MPAGHYVCPKCSHTIYESGRFRATGSFLAKIFDVQGKRFTTVTCQRCHYVEIYQADSSMLEDIFDLFT